MMKRRKSNEFMRRGSGDSQVASSTRRAGKNSLEQPSAKGKTKKAGRAILADVIGPARIIDNDFLEVAGEQIRLHGIDAPESRHMVGFYSAVDTPAESMLPTRGRLRGHGGLEPSP